MRVGIPLNIQLGKAGGVETYARNLVRSLQNIDRENEYILFCTALNEEAFPVVNPNFSKVITGKSKTIEKAKLKIQPVAGKIFEFMDEKMILREFKRAAKYVIFEGLRVTGHSAESGSQSVLDILHYLFTVLPYKQDFRAPVVLTMVDIQQEFFPEFFTKGELETRRRYYRPSAEKADHIIAISRFTKQTIVEKYGIPEDKVTVVYLGYDSKSYRRLEEKTVEEFRAAYQLPKKFLFYPAASWPHKNHPYLVRAFRILKDRYGFEGKLVLTGIKKGGYGAIEKEIKALKLNGEIVYLGYLPYGDLPLLYNAASLLVFPSLFEGFGIPVVEAFATGLPVACSNTTSLPEVGGDAAVYFNPESPEDIADKVFKVWSDKGLRESLVKNGFERAQMFTWENTARETLKVYEKVYASFIHPKGR